MLKTMPEKRRGPKPIRFTKETFKEAEKRERSNPFADLGMPEVLFQSYIGDPGAGSDGIAANERRRTLEMLSSYVVPMSPRTTSWLSWDETVTRDPPAGEIGAIQGTTVALDRANPEHAQIMDRPISDFRVHDLREESPGRYVLSVMPNFEWHIAESPAAPE